MGLGTRLDLSMTGCWKQNLIGLAKVRYIIMNTGEIVQLYETYMQLRAAKSLCKNFCSER